jgi:hypothetical protein
LLSELNEGKQQSSVANNYNIFSKRLDLLTPGEAGIHRETAGKPRTIKLQTFAVRSGLRV